MTEEEVVARLGFAVGDYFGGCPECGKQDSILNIWSSHWAVCREHKNKWCIGANLFSCWREEDEFIWRQNWETLRECVEVKSVPPTDPTCYASSDCYERAMADALRLSAERRRLALSVVALRA
jgi:hypothetical protein